MLATDSTSGGCASILGPKIDASYQSVWFGRYGKHIQKILETMFHADLD